MIIHIVSRFIPSKNRKKRFSIHNQFVVRTHRNGFGRNRRQNQHKNGDPNQKIQTADFGYPRFIQRKNKINPNNPTAKLPATNTQSIPSAGETIGSEPELVSPPEVFGKTVNKGRIRFISSNRTPELLIISNYPVTNTFWVFSLKNTYKDLPGFERSVKAGSRFSGL